MLSKAPSLSEAELSSAYQGSPGLEDDTHPDGHPILPSLEAWQFAEWPIETTNAQELDGIPGFIEDQQMLNVGADDTCA